MKKGHEFLIIEVLLKKYILHNDRNLLYSLIGISSFKYWKEKFDDTVFTKDLHRTTF